MNSNSLFLARLPIVTPGVSIVRMELGDLDRLYEIESDPITRTHLAGPGPGAKKDWIPKARAMVLDEMAPGAVRLSNSDAIIGRCTLSCSSPDSYSLEIVLASAFLGHGYGTEVRRTLLRVAFDELGAYQVTAYTKLLNARARALALSAGFKETSTDNFWRYFTLSQADYHSLEME